MNTKIYTGLLLVTVIVLLGGCSQGSSVSPTLDPTNSRPSQDFSAGRQVWGLWEISIDPDSLSADITPLRFGEFHANVRKFLEEGPCFDCLSVQPPIIPQPYGFDVDIAITHPFPGLSYYIGFDVRGIVMLEGSFQIANLLTTCALRGDSALLNPDGWTMMFNANDYTQPGIFGYSKGKMVSPLWPAPTNDLNAFKAYYSEGQGEDELGRRAFLNGDTVVRTYQLQFKEGAPLRFWYAIDASWEPPTGEEPFTVDDFDLTANCPEAYRVDISVVSGELYAGIGLVTLGVDIWDHQSVLATGGFISYAPECTNSDGYHPNPPIYVDGDKGHWEIEIQNEGQGLDPALGAELLIKVLNNEDDPFTGLVNGFGRFTIPVSTDPPPVVVSINPDYGFQDGGVDNAEITGANFVDGCAARLEKPGQADIDGLDIVFIDDQHITADFLLTGAALGFWDVVVTNPDLQSGTLSDGFEVVEPSGCNSAIHTNNLGTGDFGGGTHMTAYDAVFVHDTGTVNDGEFLGYISGFAGTVVPTYIIDTLTPVDGDPLGPGWGNPHIGSWPVPLSIDVAEETGNFFIVWNDTDSIVEVWTAQGGKLAGETNASNTGIVFSLDTDGSGGFWNGFFPEWGFAPGIKHFTPDGPQPGELVENMSDAISLPEVWGTPYELICIPGDKLLVLTGYDNGKIRSYDISQSPPVYIGEIANIFSGSLSLKGWPNKPCDMVADWSDPNYADCRIIAMGNLESGDVELVKIGSDLTIYAGPTVVASKQYHSIDINPTTGDLALWPPSDGMNPGEYALIEQPAGW